MFTRNLWSLSSQERGALKIMIREYAQPGIVAQHHLTNGAHGGNEGDGIRFFEWHRAYLRGLEAFLEDAFRPDRSGSPVVATNRKTNAVAKKNEREVAAGFQLRRLGPAVLPYWEPWSGIPPEFATQDDAGQVHTPTPITREWFSWWLPDQVCGWLNADRMGLVLSWGPHFWVHFFSGGAMAQLQRAPQAPIFWPWHAYVDNIYSTYLQGGKGGSLDPKSPPWGPQPPPPRGPVPFKPGADQRTVPFCLGASQLAAKGIVENAGLEVGRTFFFRNELDIVVIQWPMPNAIVPEGTKVDLTSAQPCPC